MKLNRVSAKKEKPICHLSQNTFYCLHCRYFIGIENKTYLDLRLSPYFVSSIVFVYLEVSSSCAPPAPCFVALYLFSQFAPWRPFFSSWDILILFLEVKQDSNQISRKYKNHHVWNPDAMTARHVERCPKSSVPPSYDVHDVQLHEMTARGTRERSEVVNKLPPIPLPE